jgi:cob(I)alamin adenosyltransferase
MSIATKTGDGGTTALMFNRRVSKSDIRVATYGACDELNVAIGMARAWNDDAFITQPLEDIQKELVTLMGELAVAEDDRARYVEKGYKLVGPEMAARLTALVDDLEKNHKISFKHWATPGSTKGSVPPRRARCVHDARGRLPRERRNRALSQPPLRPRVAVRALCGDEGWCRVELRKIDAETRRKPKMTF